MPTNSGMRSDDCIVDYIPEMGLTTIGLCLARPYRRSLILFLTTAEESCE